MNSLFQSLQARLVFSFVIVTSVALAVAAGVFVAATRDDQERRELDRVAAVSPAVVNEFFFAALNERQTFSLKRFAAEASERHNVRILLINEAQVVSADSQGSLVGEALALPSAGTFRLSSAGQAYTAFQSTNGIGDDLVFVESALPFAGISAQDGPFIRDLPAERLVLAVPRNTITRAWLGLLPALGAAAAVAFPVAILCAILLARSIARPVQQLTLASRQLASGSFDIELRSDRADELGQLSDAFSNMAIRVGAAQSQMRQLIANVSHDLKTPLTSILGFSHALSTGPAPSSSEAQRMGAVIEKEATRLSQRLTDLLYLSEIDAGRALVDWGRVDLSALVASVAQRLFAPSDARLRPLELVPELVVVADAAKLERVVENLISNAAKFTAPTGEIRMRTYIDTREGAHFQIANSAPDLPVEDLPRLFDRFYRGDSARTAASGSGLGLAIARDLARLMHGTLDARHHGGTLTVTLRIARASVTAEV